MQLEANLGAAGGQIEAGRGQLAFPKHPNRKLISQGIDKQSYINTFKFRPLTRPASLARTRHAADPKISRKWAKK